MSNYSKINNPICPVCNNTTLDTGEKVDFYQVTPDTCDMCGYIQPKDKREFDEMAQLAKCWELQLDYWSRQCNT